MYREKFAVWYETYLGRIIPRYAFFSVIFCFVFNSLVYSGTQWLMGDAKHYDLSTEFDLKLPFIPQWIYIYLICFAFWAVNYVIITRNDKDTWFKFAVGDYLSRLVCGVFFVLMPTTNVRPVVDGGSFAEILTRFVYNVDPATNLFPSIHCLVSWMCFIGIRKRKDVPLWYKVFSCVFAIMIFASTQFTKQHYILDVISGVLIAEVCYYIGCHTKMYCGVEQLFGNINNRIFGDTSHD